MGVRPKHLFFNEPFYNLYVQGPDYKKLKNPKEEFNSTSTKVGRQGVSEAYLAKLPRPELLLHHFNLGEKSF